MIAASFVNANLMFLMVFIHYINLGVKTWDFYSQELIGVSAVTRELQFKYPRIQLDLSVQLSTYLPKIMSMLV